MCHNVPVEIGGIVERVHIFVSDNCAHDLILGRPWEGAVRASYKNEDNGACYLHMKSRDGTKEILMMVAAPNHPRNRHQVRDPDPRGRRTEKDHF